MVSVTLEAETVTELLQQAAQLAAQLAGLLSVAASDKTAPADANPTPAKRGRPAKSPEQRATEAAEAQIEKSVTVKTALDNAPSPFGEVSEIISTLVAKAGKPATVKLLGEFGVKRASELNDAQYGPFLAAAKKLLS